MRLKSLLFIFMMIGFAAEMAFASATSIRINRALQYTYRGQTYIIPRNQVYSGDCSSGSSCLVRTNGVRLQIPMNFLSGVGTDSYSGRSGSLFSSSFGSSSEVGNGGFGGYSPRQSTMRFPSSSFGNSSLVQCYRNRTNYYASRGGCTNGNRNCSYSKPTNVSTGYCYRYVKLILQDCGAAKGYMPGGSAFGAGPSLVAQGFRRLPTLNPHEAPVGSVIVYSNQCRATNPNGHVEIKIGNNQYASDFVASTPISDRTSCRRVAGIYIK